jgi:hypothetical protein
MGAAYYVTRLHWHAKRARPPPARFFIFSAIWRRFESILGNLKYLHFISLSYVLGPIQ